MIAAESLYCKHLKKKKIKTYTHLNYTRSDYILGSRVIYR